MGWRGFSCSERSHHGRVGYQRRQLSRKSKAVRRAIRAAGAKLFHVPPYSPDLNPIEQDWSK
jgi:transposase